MKNETQINKLKQIIANLILMIVFGILLTSCINNQKTSERKGKIDDLLKYCYENELFNGTVLVASSNEIIYQNALGFTSYDCKNTLKLNSVFGLASVSKTFTSVAIMILKEGGKLQYEDKLSKYLPDFPNSDKITIRNLLTHTSGVANYLAFGGFRVEGLPGDFIDGVTNQKAYDYLKSINTLNFTPGDKFEYSNGGYLMLSLVVEKASGKPFHEFIQNEIFNPLKMENSFVISKPDLIIPNRAYGFTNYKSPDDDNLLTTGGGGIFSTVEDLLKWDKALSSESLVSQQTLGKAFEVTVLNDGSLSHNMTDSTNAYGMGWVFKKTKNSNIVFHDGGLNACVSMFYRDLGSDYTIIILSNKGSTNRNHPIYAIHDGIDKIMKGEKIVYPKIPISLKMDGLLRNYSLKEAVARCQEIWKNEQAQYDCSIDGLNSLGYYYLQNNDYEKAKAVFELNINFYPENENVYDSYAESLMLSKDFVNAIHYYKKSLELNPENENAIQMIKRMEIDE